MDGIENSDDKYEQEEKNERKFEHKAEEGGKDHGQKEVFQREEKYFGNIEENKNSFFFEKNPENKDDKQRDNNFTNFPVRIIIIQ